MNLRDYRRLALFLTAILSMLLLAAACGDDDDDDGGDAPTQASDDATSTGDEEATEESDEGDGESDGLGALRRAAAEGPDIFYTAYDMSVSGATGEEDFEGTFILAAREPNELFSLKYTDADGEHEITVISNAESTYTCLVEAGDEGTCIESPVGQSPFGDLTSTFVTTDDLVEELANEDGVEVSDAGSKEVAGLDANCYDVRDDTGDGTVCIAEDENLIVEMVGSFDGSDIEFRLTEYDDDPGDDVFEPRYEVVDLGG